jgi:hypothetical protein
MEAARHLVAVSTQSGRRRSQRQTVEEFGSGFSWQWANLSTDFEATSTDRRSTLSSLMPNAVPWQVGNPACGETPDEHFGLVGDPEGDRSSTHPVRRSGPQGTEAPGTQIGRGNRKGDHGHQQADRHHTCRGVGPPSRHPVSSPTGGVPSPRCSRMTSDRHAEWYFFTTESAFRVRSGLVGGQPPLEKPGATPAVPSAAMTSGRPACVRAEHGKN